jgi:uncharacterized protein involved in cysteine biosynthesis
MGLIQRTKWGCAASMPYMLLELLFALLLALLPGITTSVTIRFTTSVTTWHLLLVGVDAADKVRLQARSISILYFCIHQ